MGRQKRRSFLRLAATGCCLSVVSRKASARREAAGQDEVGGPTVVVAGPKSSQAGAWGMLMAPSIDHAAIMGGKLRLRFVGGQDGVTGANQFEAGNASGEQDALLMPGTAALAWVAGDSRVRFDAARLIPILSSISPGLLMIRPPAAHKTALRVGCSGAVEPSLAGLLALDLLGVPASPARLGLDCLDAARAGLVDAVFLHGPDVPRQRRELQGLGFRPCFGTGSVGAAAAVPEPALAGVPNLTEALAARPAANLSLLQAYRAVAAASVLDVTLALPALSGSAIVSRWRLACAMLCSSPDMLDVAASRSLRLVSGDGSAQAMHALLADGPSQSVLRRWLSTRLGWRPT